MRPGHTLVTLSLAIGLLAACGNEIEISRTEPEVGASPEVQRFVSEIDAMLVVPQTTYQDGNAFSSAFEELFDAVVKQKPTRRTSRVSERMAHFIAAGDGLGWDPQEADVERLAREWSEFRPDVLAGP